MDIDLIFKIGAIGAADRPLISQILSRAGREDIATLATLAGLIVVMMMVVGMVSEFFESIRAMFNFK